MNDAATYAILTEVFRDVFDDDALEIRPETAAVDVPGWDSQANITLLVATEMRFGVRFRTVEIEALRNVADLVGLIHAKGAAEGGR